MIETFGLTKCFGTLTAVNGLNLSIRQGEFFAFLGPNAAGKTTTIKMLTGLLRPTAGRCRVGGFDLQTEPKAAKAILSYVPDFPFLYDKLTSLGIHAVRRGSLPGGADARHAEKRASCSTSSG